MPENMIKIENIINLNILKGWFENMMKITNVTKIMILLRFRYFSKDWKETEKYHRASPDMVLNLVGVQRTNEYR